MIEQGLAHNVNLVNAALNVKIIEEQLKCAKLAFVPSFTFSPQGTISSWDGGKATKSYSLPISASWTIDLFGNILSKKRSVQAALLATKDYQLVVKTKLIANIANAYYTLLMLDKQIEVVTDKKETHFTIEESKKQQKVTKPKKENKDIQKVTRRKKEENVSKDITTEIKTEAFRDITIKIEDRII